MEVKEAINKLKEIRMAYETGMISMVEANRQGKPLVKIANDFYKKKAEEYQLENYGFKPKTYQIPNNVKFYPKNF